MTQKTKRTIVSSKYRLSNYPIKHIDQLTLELLQSVFPEKDSKNDWGGKITSLLDVYLGVTEQKITFLSLSKKSINRLFSGFYGALLSDEFIGVAEVTRNAYTRFFRRAVEVLSAQIPNINPIIDVQKSITIWEKETKSPVEIEYYQGWLLKGKNGIERLGLGLVWFWNHFGPDRTRAVHQGAMKVTVRLIERSQGNYVAVLNEFVNYLEFNHSKTPLSEFQNSQFTTSLVEDFCRSFFNRVVEKKLDLETSIKRWNDCRFIFVSAFFDSGAFAKPFRDYPYIEPKRKPGSETKIRVDENNNEIKEKLIVDVPLQLTDDEAIELIFKQIDSHISMVEKWAKAAAEEQHQKSKKQKEIDIRVFGKDVSAHQKRRFLGLKINSSLIKMAKSIGVPRSYSLEPFMYLLIKEHPTITESFLTGLELYDKNGKLVAIEETDNCSYLIGYKKRKGGDKSLQRIKLNDISKTLINQVLDITEKARDYLKSINDDNYRFLFLSTRIGFSKPTKITTIFNPLRADSAREERITQVVNSLYGNIKGSERDFDKEKEDALKLIKKLSMTKFRATVAVQIFLKTKSAKKMAEELGHELYKPELLSHYLPEPLLQFFQSRWIRIFQKGLICEATKNTPYQLRASNFSTMDELDEFLNNHALKLPKENEDLNSAGVSDVLVSVDENILTALLSLEAAVLASPTQDRISAKAIYWSRFSQLITLEIQQNRYDREIKSALEKAKMNIDHTTMQEMIYA